MAKAETPERTHCSQSQEDDPRHTVFVYDAWHRERSELRQSLRQIGEKEQLVLIMLRSEDGRKKVDAFA